MQDFQRWSRLLRQMQGENQARAGKRDMKDIETDDDGELSDKEARFFAE